MGKTILTCDPSITGWGWAVISDQGTLLDCGCIKTTPTDKKLRIRKGDDTVRRVHEINTALLAVITAYDVHYMLSELPHGSQSAVAAKMIGIVTGIAQTLADACQLGIEWYSEGDAKMFMLGKRSAVKQEMIDAVTKKMIVTWTGIKYKDEAVADSLAIYLVAMDQSPVLKMLKQLK